MVHTARTLNFVQFFCPGTLDGSVALAWYFVDEANPYADAIARLLPRELGAVVPTIWPLEIANSFLTGERRRRSTPARSAKWAGFFEVLPITMGRVQREPSERF